MNKRKIIASLNNIANELDHIKLYRESNLITNVMKRLALDNFQSNNQRSTQDEDDIEAVLGNLFERLWVILPWKLYKENHPIYIFTGSDKIKFILKKMADINRNNEYAKPDELRSLANICKDFLRMFINSEYISRAENEEMTKKLNDFLLILDESEKAINEGKAREFYDILVPD